MAIAALSPNSVMATPLQANPQIRNEQQTTPQQVAQDAQKTAAATRTDTITISPQALKLADDSNATSRETSAQDNEQREAPGANDEAAESRRNTLQRNAVSAYVSMAPQR